MAEGTKTKLDFTRKIGPLPLWAWLGAGLGIWWYLRKQQAAQSPTTPAPQTTGYGTDPAGNTGYIDPATGYVYGSAEDIAALQSQNLVAANTYNTPPAADTSTAGAPTDTTTPVTTPSGTPVTTPGAAPGPTLTGGTPPPAPGGSGWRYPAPTGLQTYNVTSTGFRVRWNPVTQGSHKPGSYTVQTVQMNGKKVDQWSPHGTDVAEYGAGGKGLHPGWQYRVNVWANGGPQAPGHASTVVTLKPKGK